jgi:heme acquisition protein HasR
MRTRHPQRRPRDFVALTLLATTALIPISALAQDAAPSELDSVLVTGARNAAKADLTAEQIQRRNASSVADLIEQVSGLSLNSLYSRPEVSVGVQGVAGHGRVVLQLEGISQNFHAFTADIGQTGSIFIDPMLLAGIDVTRGGGTGTSTLGGLGSAVDFRYTNVGDVLEPGKTFGGIARLSTGVTNWGNGQRPAGSVFVAGRSDHWQWMLGTTHVDNDAYRVGGNFSMSQMAENFHGNNIKFYDGIRNITSEGGCRYYGITGVADGSRDGLTTCQLSRQQLSYLKQAAKSGALEGTEKRSASTILRLGYDFGGEHDQRLDLFAVNSRARYRTEQAPTISIPGAWDGGQVGDDAYWKDDLWDVRTVLKSTVASLGYSGAFSDRLNPSARIYYEEQQRNQNWTGMQGSYAFGAPLHYHAKNASFGLKLDNAAYLAAPVLGRVRLDAGIEVRRRDKTVDSLTEQEYLRDYQASLGYIYESPKWDPDSRNDTFGAALALSTDGDGPFKASLGAGWQRVKMTVESPTYLTGNQAKAGVDDRPTKLTELRAYYRSLGYSSSVARQMAIADLVGYSDQFKIDTSRGTTRYVYDDAHHRFDLKSANLLLQYTPEGSGFSGRAQVSYNARAPTSNEMYVAGVWNFVTFTANPDLKPEKNTSLQLGADYARAGLWSPEDRLKVGLLLYRNDIRNYIGFGPIIGHDTVTYVSSEQSIRKGYAGGTASVNNLKPVIRQGIEANFEYRQPMFNLRGSMTVPIRRDNKMCSRLLPGGKAYTESLDANGNTVYAELTDAGSLCYSGWSWMETSLIQPVTGTFTATFTPFGDKAEFGAAAHYRGKQRSAYYYVKASQTNLVGATRDSLLELPDSDGWLTVNLFPEVVKFDLFASYKITKDVKLGVYVANVTDRMEATPTTFGYNFYPGRTLKANLELRF